MIYLCASLSPKENRVSFVSFDINNLRGFSSLVVDGALIGKSLDFVIFGPWTPKRKSKHSYFCIFRP